MQENSLASVDVQREYFLLLIDLVGSSRLHPQLANSIFIHLEEALTSLNARAPVLPGGGSDLVVPLSVSYGDEVSGLFASPRFLYQCVDFIRKILLPDIEIRFVAARGRVGRSSSDIRKIGGPAFKQAAEAMLSIKKSRRFCCWLIGDQLLNNVLNSLTEMSHALITDMTGNQRDILWLSGKGMTHSAIAKTLGKGSRQTISESASRAHAQLVLDAEAAIQKLLVSRQANSLAIPRAG